MEWVILHNDSRFPICESEKENSVPAAATAPVTDEAEPTADVEPEPATIQAPVRIETEPTIVLKPKPKETSDQVCEPATASVPEGILVEFEG